MSKYKPVVHPDDKFEVYNLETDESHGTFPTYEQAMGAVRYDKLTQYQIWQGYVSDGEFISCVRVVSQETYDDIVDPRVREGLGLPALPSDMPDSPSVRGWWEDR